MASTIAVVPIQSLDPSIPPPTSQAIRALVTLCWPYSSSTRQCALLLADPDFRLRSRKGQVRVCFYGASAEAIAKAKPGIGDEVELELGGASWVSSGVDGDVVQTPGKSVGELEYRGGVKLRLGRDGGSVQDISVKKDVASGQAHAQVHTREVTQTVPDRSPIRGGSQASFGAAPAVSNTYSSPTFLHRARFAKDDTLDRLFAEETDGDSSPRKRVRVSIGEVRDWRVVSRTPSPVKEHSPVKPFRRPLDLRTSASESSILDMDGHNDVSSQIDEHEVSSSPTPAPQAFDENVNARAMLPPALPRLQVPQLHNGPDHVMGGTDEPTTPRLRPISSAKLTAPSPFPTAVAMQSKAPLLREIPGTYAEDDEMIDADPADTSGDNDDLESQPQLLQSSGNADQDGQYQGSGTTTQVRSVAFDALSQRQHVDDDDYTIVHPQPNPAPSDHAKVDDISVDATPTMAAERQLSSATPSVDLDTQVQAPSSSPSTSVAARDEYNYTATGKELQPAPDVEVIAPPKTLQSASPVRRHPIIRQQQYTVSRKIGKQSLAPTGYFKSGWDEVVPSDISTFASGWNEDAGVDAMSTAAGRQDRVRISGTNKVLEGAFKSLFGFPGTPSPTKEDPSTSLPVQHDVSNYEYKPEVPHPPAQIPQEGMGARESSPASIPQFDGPTVSKPSVFGWKVSLSQKLLPVNEPPLELLSPADAGMVGNAAEVKEDLPEDDDLAQRIDEPDFPTYNGQPPTSTAHSAVDVIDLGSSSDAEDDLNLPARTVSQHAVRDQSSPYLPSSPAPYDFAPALKSVESGDDVEELDYGVFINEPDEDSDQEDDRSRLGSLAVQSIATAGSNKMTPILPDDVESAATASHAASVRGSSFEPINFEGSATPLHRPTTASPVQQVEGNSQPLAHPQLPGGSPAQLDQPSLTTSTADLSFQQISSSPLARSQHSPAHDIEMLDLSQPYVAEYAASRHGQPQSISQLSQRSNRVAVEGSIDSPQTTLIDETSSRPGSGSDMVHFQASQVSAASNAGDLVDPRIMDTDHIRDIRYEELHTDADDGLAKSGQQQSLSAQKPRPQQRSHLSTSVSASPAPPEAIEADGTQDSSAAKSFDEISLINSEVD
ncbi:hypothetical protein LTR95_010791, partial [Oleoguttula sp. CCFEE 5521]